MRLLEALGLRSAIFPCFFCHFVTALVTVLWTLSGATSLASEDSCTLRIAWNSYPPYMIDRGEGREPEGVEPVILKHILEPVGCRLAFVELPVKRAFRALENGTVDIIPIASFVPERERYGLFSLPYRDEEARLYGRPETIEAHLGYSFEELMERPLTIGAVNGGWYGKAIEELERRQYEDPAVLMRLHRVPDHDTLHGTVLGGRLDMMVSDRLWWVWNRQIRGNQDRLVDLGVLLHRDAVHMMLSRTLSKDLVAAVNRSIACFREQPETHLRCFSE
ncbi:substrate-binding periplasmic protein [Kiloniella sp. b19]|uniref:substrate-binding periplasmic protein n=1 Tax=Kiloniella sp. GXU_MW_B19 TaxID=3141326 RepID=UPI0031D15507